MCALRTADANTVSSPVRGVASPGRYSGATRLFGEDPKSPGSSRRHFTESKVVAVPDCAQHTGLRMSAGPLPAAQRTPSTDRVRLKRTCSPPASRVETPSSRRHVQSTATSISVGNCNVEASPQRRLLRQVPSPPHEEPAAVRHRVAVPAPPVKEERTGSKGMVAGFSERNWTCSQSDIEKYRPGRHVFPDGPPAKPAELRNDGLVIPTADATSSVCFLTKHKKHFHDASSAPPPETGRETPRSGRRLVPQPSPVSTAVVETTNSPRGRRHYAAHNTASPAPAEPKTRVRSPSPPSRAQTFAFQGDVPPRPQGIARAAVPPLSTRPW